MNSDALLALVGDLYGVTQTIPQLAAERDELQAQVTKQGEIIAHLAAERDELLQRAAPAASEPAVEQEAAAPDRAEQPAAPAGPLINGVAP